ncbi:MAG: DUF1501 domain-containing protein, partial [Phycisphaerales bacterium]|nr:DUF1501 domain-containing protein [Phycisphaerales bacterium]
TTVPGIEVSPLFPRQARAAQHFSVVRSIHHDTGDHFAGGHRMLTAKNLGVSGANTAQKFPGLGAIAGREVGPRAPGMPAYVAVPHAASIGLVPGYFGGHMIGAQHDPFVTGDPSPPGYQVPNLNLAAGLTVQSLDDRRGLLTHFDTARRQLDGNPTAAALDQFGRQAYEFVTGPAARAAFDMSKEPERLRDRYGRNGWGQSCLLARRLVEAGSTFVAVHFGGWDHHWDLQKGYEDCLPRLDMAVATLYEDLADRGQLDTTLVVVCGEFGRTPKMNDGGNGGAPMSQGTPGRDHWGHAMSVLMGGGGVKGGTVVGSTDRLGQHPKTRPLTPSNLHATIYQVLGIDPKLQLTDPTGRPVNTLDDPDPITELL